MQPYLLILRTLEHGPMHAYGVGRRLREGSEGVLDVAEGVLYPALHRLEERALLAPPGHAASPDAGRSITS